MKFSLLAFPALAAAAAIPQPDAMITDAPTLVKRGGTQEKQLTDKVWTSISSGVTMKITPTVIDGVTISASPVSSATVWASLDGSGIPYLITPTVSDGTTVSTSPTPTASGYPAADAVPPVLRCFGDRVPEDDDDKPGYPFCTALNGTEMVVGETYWITWDPTYFDSDSITKVSISLIAYPQTGSSNDTLFTSNYVSRADGYYPLTMRSQYIRKGNGYMWLTITPLVTSQSDATTVGTKTGPLIRAIISDSEASTTIAKVPSDNNLDTASSSSSKSNKAKVIAPAVVIPVICVIAIAAGVVWYLNKQKKSRSGSSGARDVGAGSGPRAAGAGAGSSTGGVGDIHLSRTTTKENASIVTEETGHNPFQETSRTVL
ncbi:CYFA0S03e01354g1_1 [Cyberlindnera fabianii]|uniref:CYFA0S03e01354g1_1 n=1 Tax=Cyberlindnera fabianii TaxID=36022 RepID=A0A061ANQ8_CYBFA|nr:hypothetical protein BON22_4559 [Cyberlindnera fabianii]CDR39252.1 CYFA0S03e01354g1_1 [Cyberlindnera fabianii]